MCDFVHDGVAVHAFVGDGRVDYDKRPVFHTARVKRRLNDGERRVRVVAECGGECFNRVHGKRKGFFGLCVVEVEVVYVHLVAVQREIRFRQGELVAQTQRKISHVFGGDVKHCGAVRHRAFRDFARSCGKIVFGKGNPEIKGSRFAVKRVARRGVFVLSPRSVFVHAE